MGRCQIGLPSRRDQVGRWCCPAPDRFSCRSGTKIESGRRQRSARREWLLSAGSAASGVCKKRRQGTELVEVAMIGCRIGKKTLEVSTPEAFHTAETVPPPCGSAQRPK